MTDEEMTDEEMTDEATPRPWRVDGFNLVIDEHGHNIALVNVHRPAAANTALIVKAVNQHDFLIDFIREFEREGTVSGTRLLRAHARAILKQEDDSNART